MAFRIFPSSCILYLSIRLNEVCSINDQVYRYTQIISTSTSSNSATKGVMVYGNGNEGEAHCVQLQRVACRLRETEQSGTLRGRSITPGVCRTSRTGASARETRPIPECDTATSTHAGATILSYRLPLPNIHNRYIIFRINQNIFPPFFKLRI